MRVDELFASRYGQLPPEFGGEITKSLTGAAEAPGGGTGMSMLNQMIQSKMKKFSDQHSTMTNLATDPTTPTSTTEKVQ